MNDYIVYENQTLQDIAAHVYGRVDVVMDLALLNNISITEKLLAGQTIKLVDTTINTLVKKALESRNIIPAVDFNQTDIQAPEIGIGTMIIETNFTVG
jgi:hypothetical protein